jgi:predicted amidohydrolase YtcJ
LRLEPPVNRLSGVLLCAGLAGCASRDAADLILVNGNVYTLDRAQPRAQAIAVDGEWIVAVGSNAEIRRYAGAATRTIDLDGAHVFPGFNDAHVHIQATGALLTGANLLDVHEAGPFVERIKGAAARLPVGSWITRGDWGAYERWAAGSAGEPAGGRAAGRFTPSRDLIDSVTPDHPAFVRSFDGAMYLANTRAMEAAGIGARTPAPQAGTIERDAAGRPTGILRGTAVNLVERVIPPIPFEQRLAQVRAVLQEAREGGVTTMQDLTTPEQLQAYRELQRRGELTARILLRPSLDNVVHTAGLGLTQGFGDHWLKLIGYKAWVDGIMGNSSAMFFRPYDHDPANKGLVRTIMLPEARPGAAMGMTESQKYTDSGVGNLERLLDQAVPTGLTPHVHAIGDKGVRILLDIYQRVLQRHDMVDSDHRWRVIHAQVLHPDDVRRFGALRLVAEVNPYHVSDDMRWMEERIGAERSKGAYAFRDLKNAGAILIFGSDSPGTNAARYYLSPVYGLYAAVTRQTLKGAPQEGWFPSQRLTIEEAIEAYTRTSAWASFEEDIKGTLAAGKLADIAVVDTDLLEVGRSQPTGLLNAKVLYTVVGGRVVFERQGR